MYKYEELKKYELENIKYLISMSERCLTHYNGNTLYDRNIRKNAQAEIECYSKALENIDELLKEQIASSANKLIETIRDSLSSISNRSYYHYSLATYLKVVAGIDVDQDGKLIPLYNVINQHSMIICEYVRKLGLTLEDLKPLATIYPDSQARDEFIKYVNNFYGIDIPMTAEMEDAKTRMSSTSMYSPNYLEVLRNWNLILLRNGNFVENGISVVFEQDIQNSYEREKQGTGRK